MSFRRMGLVILALSLVVVAVPGAEAAIVAKMDMSDLTHNAHQIFRGTVVDVEQTTVAIGGGELPAIIVQVRVDEVLKGDLGDKVEIKMLGSVKDAPVTAGNAQRVDILPNLPQLNVGGDYLLFTTEPSSIGLSTTVGLGQGAFRVYLDDQQEVASNELNNAGLFSGPVSYAALTAAIDAELGN